MGEVMVLKLRFDTPIDDRGQRDQEGKRFGRMGSNWR
jgi:hypothetical protein